LECGRLAAALNRDEPPPRQVAAVVSPREEDHRDLLLRDPRIHCASKLAHLGNWTFLKARSASEGRDDTRRLRSGLSRESVERMKLTFRSNCEFLRDEK
jgi:hypothetical protein